MARSKLRFDRYSENHAACCIGTCRQPALVWRPFRARRFTAKPEVGRLLDSNIYDKLWADENTRLRLASLILHRKVHVIATPKIVDELTRSPFKGVPDWVDVDEEIEAVAVVGHAQDGMARLGSGNVYMHHRGNSQKVEDAIIADSADDLADIAVSEDERFVRRLNSINGRCYAMGYTQFMAWL